MADRIGQRFGNYRLIRLLGWGGFAEVYQGEHVYLKSYAAIKVLHTHLVKDDIDAFLHEARTLVHLIHPYIVRLLDFGVEDAIPFLVMDYAPNDTLRHRHPKGTQVAPSVVITYVQQVADALFYAHNRKVIHRDIKPENMLVGRQNEILLSDFGIAVVSLSSRTQIKEETAGTVMYMAPEQIQAHPRASSDQYSLAIVVYEWLAGKPPFQGSFAEVAGKHLYASPQPIRELVPSVPPLLEQAVLTALAKDPKQRFANIQAFARALEQACQPMQPESVSLRKANASPSLSAPFVVSSSSGYKEEKLVSYEAALVESKDVSQFRVTEPEVVDNASLPVQEAADNISQSPQRVTVAAQQRNPPIVSRRKMMWGLALTGLGLVGAGVTWLTISRVVPQADASSPAPSPTAVLLLRYPGHTGAVYCAAWSHHGRYVASGGEDQTVQVWDATNGQLISTYRGHTKRVNVVVWSPDDTLIVSGSNDKTAQVWSVKEARHIYTYSGHIAATAGGVSQMAWSPDGTCIASGSYDKTVQVWNASDGHLLFTYRGHASDPNGYIGALVWSPDGTHLASGGSDCTVQVWDAKDGHTVYTYRGHPRPNGNVWTVAWSPDSKYIVSGSKDKTAQVWEAFTGKLLYVYRGHTESVGSVSWSFDGQRIVSGSYDKTVQVWSPTGKEHPYVYLGYAKSPKGRVWCVVWAPDSKRIASSSDEGVVLIWEPPQ